MYIYCNGMRPSRLNGGVQHHHSFTSYERKAQEGEVGYLSALNKAALVLGYDRSTTGGRNEWQYRLPSLSSYTAGMAYVIQ